MKKKLRFSMVAIISGIGTMIDFFTCLVISIRLYGPAKESNFNFRSFRGSLFWMFVLLVPFMLFMSTNLITNDVQLAGYGYVIGHLFLYLALAVYIFAPFQILNPNSRLFPNILSSIITVSAVIVTYINWDAYATKTHLPEYEDGVTIWNPPDLVFYYIAIVVMGSWILFGTVIFWYHALKTKNTKLKRRSFLIGLGLLIAAIGGPMHDAPLPGATILIADIVVALGFIIVAIGMLVKTK